MVSSKCAALSVTLIVKVYVYIPSESKLLVPVISPVDESIVKGVLIVTIEYVSPVI